MDFSFVRSRALAYEYSFPAVSNMLSSWCQYEALKYVTFPTQVPYRACSQYEERGVMQWRGERGGVHIFPRFSFLRVLCDARARRSGNLLLCCFADNPPRAK